MTATVDLQDTNWITRFECSQIVSIDTRDYLAGFPKRYIDVTWGSLTQLTLQLAAVTDMDYDSEAAACESSLASYMYTDMPLDGDEEEWWRLLAVSDLLKYGAMQVCVA